MRHYLPEKWNEVRTIQILRSSDVNPTKRSLHEPVKDSAQVNNADPDRHQRENNHDLTGRVHDANNGKYSRQILTLRFRVVNPYVFQRS